MFSVSAGILSAALFLAMVLNLAMKPKYSARLTTVCMVVALIGGLAIYGAGYAQSTESLVLTMIRTPLAVTRMFVGVNDLSAVDGTTFVRGQGGLVFFWLIHLLAFYSMASAAMITIGAEALRSLRLLLSRRGELTLIYGINDRSVDLGQECLEKNGGAVILVAEDVAAAKITEMNNLGMSVLSGDAAVNCEDRVLRALRIGNRKLSVFALEEQDDSNLGFALKLKDALERFGAAPENTRLTLPGEEEIITSMLQVSPEQYGFGYVQVFDTPTLAARALLRTCPPWDFVSFGPDGRAQEDFECAIVGFGRLGQAVLKQLVMNGQYVGSSFHATVFALDYEAESGYLFHDCPGLLNHYDIKCISADGRSAAFYSYLTEHLATLKMVAVCTGSDAVNQEIANELMLFLKRRRAERICVVRCGKKALRYQASVASPIVETGVYTLDSLSAERADREAILLNAVYDDSDRSNWEKWVACDSFSKMSSRASADFAPALIKASGAKEEEILAGNWQPDEAMQQVLGEMEHLRWCAFHYAMGYLPMGKESWEARAAEFTRCREQDIPCRIRLSKDAEERLHACLIPWDSLDELSARESAVTGRNVDYKQTDINNVLALPQILNASRPKKE